MGYERYPGKLQVDIAQRRGLSRPLYSAGDAEREATEPTPRSHVDEPYRSPWRRDFARLIHCPAFRRLQGKTQLFPGESDYFRNRLTHSLEVAQIAKSIAIKLNYEHFRDPEAEDQRISEDMVEFAALAHDLGHPPFGHQGETALDNCMSSTGGFEGNAQTLRILSRIEKKRTADWPPTEFAKGEDLRRGLNLTFRSLAAVLKYDRRIPTRPAKSKVVKGYYAEEEPLVNKIKLNVAGDSAIKDFKTVECQIMDIADDIAYSTYDFEDAMKAGFTSLLDLLGISRQKQLLRRVALKVWKKLNDRDDNFSDDKIPPELRPQIEDVERNIAGLLFNITKGVMPTDEELKEFNPKNDEERDLWLVGLSYQAAQNIQESGYYRVSLTSQLVEEFISGVRLTHNSEIPCLSKVELETSVKQKIEVLKNYTYEAHIETARLKTVDFRGGEIVKEIFECLREDKKNQLLPPDWKARSEAVSDENHRLRCISDFVAGMTDKYALEFYDRLKSSRFSTIFRDF